MRLLLEHGGSDAGAMQDPGEHQAARAGANDGNTGEGDHGQTPEN
jgi:hypothetical protein